MNDAMIYRILAAFDKLFPGTGKGIGIRFPIPRERFVYIRDKYAEMLGQAVENDPELKLVIEQDRAAR